MVESRDLKASAATLTRHADEGLIEHPKQVARNRWVYPDWTADVLRACQESPRADYASRRHHVWWNCCLPLGDWTRWQRDRLEELGRWLIGINAVNLYLRDQVISPRELADEVITHFQTRAGSRHRGRLMDGRHLKPKDQRALLDLGVQTTVTQSPPSLTSPARSGELGETNLELLTRAIGFPADRADDAVWAGVAREAERLGVLSAVKRYEVFGQFTAITAERVRDLIQGNEALMRDVEQVSDLGGLGAEQRPFVAALLMSTLALVNPEILDP